MNNKSRKKRPFEKAMEIELQGDFKALCLIIEEVANELCLRNFAFDAQRANSRTTNGFAWFDVFITDTTTMSKIPIGAVSLLSLGGNRTRLKIPPRSRWFHDGGLTPEEKIRMGLSESQYDEHFGQFIKSLKDRLRNHGAIATWYKKLWHESKDFITTIIAKFAAEKTK